ncbi:hypothetical protein ABEB36_004845 [Hypothenemus hampei]|uniref:RNA helicase n=1 Tax=Hypothenemus hampei TaxID=57062 RepID=A0ABD1EW14_HYPHA
MSFSPRKNCGASWRHSGGSNVQSFSHRHAKRENVRFGVNKKSRNNLVIDKQIQEATPEHLRIEIDQIFKKFVSDPSETEYIFPPDYNNLQRKYIHYKAQIMNVSSRSHGKEPNRQLHLKKKPKELINQAFQVPVSDSILHHLQDFYEKHDDLQLQSIMKHRPVKRFEKIYGRLQDSLPLIPEIIRFPNKEIEKMRQQLPLFEKRQLILDAINTNQVTIISSETGSGKTTQIPQYILEEAALKKIPCKIICTQPRRIAAIAAAQRVSYERGEPVGSSIGYQIRLESKCGPNSYVFFCTVGVFLRNLMCGNSCLKKITHILVDEIHERDKLSDFLLICLKQNLELFPNVKIILMSATVDTTKFQEYFKCNQVLSLPGRLFPIQSFFLEDVLSMTQYSTPHMKSAMSKIQQRQNSVQDTQIETAKLSEQDQANWDSVLESYLNFSDNYDYKIHYEEATADLLQLLISEGIPVDQQHSEKGYSALMIACQLGDLEFIGKLCTLGASIDVADAFGKTAMDYAKLANKCDVLEILDFIKSQKGVVTETNIDDSPNLLQLYDMTTPDDFIDYNLIVALIKYIDANSDSGSVLIFLPGYDEIMQCNDYIVNSNIDESTYRVFFLHSNMNMRDQCDVFKVLPNQRKLILSTNIAETSITVEDVVVVIDVGKVKEKIYDSYNRLSTLQTQWISRSCAKQRQGRAGRVRPGFCFRLYSRQRYNYMSEERVPEILRVSLEELCLHAKIIAPRSMNVYEFLSLAPDPPSVNSVAVAIEHLQYLGALDREEDLTKLGEYLAQLALEPRLGKMLIVSCIFKCLEPILTLCAAMAHKDPFQLPPQANLKTLAMAKRQELINDVPSDHSVYLLVFQKWQDAVVRGRSKQFCSEYFVSESTMYSVLDTRRLLLGQLRAVGFVNNSRCIDDFNYNTSSWSLVKAIMLTGFFPNIAYPVQQGLALATKDEKKVSIVNTSICTTKSYNHWYFYDEMVKNRINFMIRGVSVCSPFMIALMCGINVIYPSSCSVKIDDWLEFNFASELPIKFRKTIQSLLHNSLSNPRYSFEKKNLIISNTLCKIVDIEERSAGIKVVQNVGIRPKFLYKITSNPNFKYENGAMKELDQSTKGVGFNSFFNTYFTTICFWKKIDFITMHKQGRTPKRFIPPNKQAQYREHKAAASRNLAFDNIPSATNFVQNFQQCNLNTDVAGAGQSNLYQNPNNDYFALNQNQSFAGHKKDYQSSQKHGEFKIREKQSNKH